MQVFRDLLSSKKTWTVLIALMVAAGARFGLQLDEATCAGILGIFAVLVHAQGNADQGKEAAKIAAGGTTSEIKPTSDGGVVQTVTPASATPTPPAGFISVGLLVGIGIGLIAAVGLSACGASARQKTINATYASANLAGPEIASYSREHEEEIRKSATSAEDAKAKLTEFRAKVDHATTTLDGVYRAIAAAAALNDDVSLASLTQAAVILMTELRELGAIK